MKEKSERGRTLSDFFLERTDGMSADYSIIVGLGNPGKKYEGTRHNVGFYIVDELARRFGADLSMQRWEAQYALTSQWNRKLCFVKPQTFMNLSGKSVSRFVQFYKTPVQRVLVIHDDIDMSCGRLKIVCGSGAGGHNGIRSLIKWLGSKEFCRVKFGIGRPVQRDGSIKMPVDKFVLSTFAEGERRLVDERINVIEQGVEMLVHDEISAAQNLINSVK